MYVGCYLKHKNIFARLKKICSFDHCTMTSLISFYLQSKFQEIKTILHLILARRLKSNKKKQDFFF